MLVLAEGFDDWVNDTTSFFYYGTLPFGSNTNSGVTTGTDGGICKLLNNNDVGDYYLNIFVGNQTDLIVGFYIKYSGTAYAGRNLCAFRAWEGTFDYIMGNVALDSGRLKISYNNSFTNYVATGSLLSVNVWYHVEIKFVLGTSGSIEVRLNGVADCIVTNINTNYSNAGFISYIQFRSVAESTYIDDLIIMNLLGTEFNDWLGPVYIKKLLGSSVGSYDEFTVQGTLTATQLIQQTPKPTNHNNYLQKQKNVDSPILARQSFFHQTLTTDYQVVGVVQAVYHCTWGLTPNNSVKAFVKNNVDLLVSDPINQQASVNPHWDYVYYSKAPDGGAWTPYKLNTSEFGIVMEEA